MNGITLRADYGPYIVTAISPTQHFYTDTGLSSALTLPAVITSTTTWYCAPAYSDFYTFTCTQLDGSDISPGVPQWVGTTADSTLNPRPSLGQIAADQWTPRLGYLQSTYYYLTGQGATTSSYVVQKLNLHPFFVPNDCAISKIGAEVTGAGGSGSVFRIGVYADTGYCYPGALLLDAGTIDGTSATVQDITLGSNLTLTRGLYWFGGAAQVGTAPTMRVHNAQPATLVRVSTSTPGTNQLPGGYTQSSVTGALPSTFTTTPAMQSVTQQARIHMLVA